MKIAYNLQGLKNHVEILEAEKRTISSLIQSLKELERMSSLDNNFELIKAIKEISNEVAILEENIHDRQQFLEELYFDLKKNSQYIKGEMDEISFIIDGLSDRTV